MSATSSSAITAAMLQKFCATEAGRPTFCHIPFSQGKYTYTTNGSLIVRVDRLVEVAEFEGAPRMEPFFKSAFRTGRKLKFGPIPGIPVSRSDEGLAPVVIGPGAFQARFLRLFAELPGVVVAPGEDDYSPCRIRFEGGLAVCMPLKTK